MTYRALFLLGYVLITLGKAAGLPVLPGCLVFEAAHVLPRAQILPLFSHGMKEG